MHNISTKKLFLIVFAAVLLWKNGAQQLLWQRIFSSAIVEKSEKEPALKEFLTLYELPTTEKMHIGGEDVYIKKVGKYRGFARAMCVSSYNTSFYIGFRSVSAKFDKFFNDVAQVDIALAVGETAKDGNWQKFDVYHDNRCAVAKFSNRYDLPIYKEGELSNNHIIPANNNIRRVFDLIKKGKTVYIEGDLVDLWGKIDGIYDIEMETARSIGQYWDRPVYGGQITGACRQIYVTKVIYNNYVYE